MTKTLKNQHLINGVKKRSLKEIHKKNYLKRLKENKKHKLNKNILKEVLKEVISMTKKNNNYNNVVTIKHAYSKAIEFLNKLNKNIIDNNILKYGNLKLENNIARFTLPEVVTCMANCHGCYAKKRLFATIKEYRLKNLFIILYLLKCNKFKNKFKEVLKLELNQHHENCIKNNKLAIFRWHDSGDIFNLDYYNFIKDICNDNQNINFYTYTKNYKVYLQYLKDKEENKINNLNIVSSFIYGHVNYFDFMHNFDEEFHTFKQITKKLRDNKENVFICDYNFIKFKKHNIKNYNRLIRFIKNNKDIVFMNKKHVACGSCHACMSFKYVCFLKH